MTTNKKQMNVRLSDKARDMLTAIGKFWRIPERTQTVEKMIQDTYQRELKKK